MASESNAVNKVPLNGNTETKSRQEQEKVEADRRFEIPGRLQNTALGENGSHHQSDTSSKGSGHPKPTPESLPTGLQKKSNDSIAFDKTCLVTVDASTNTVNVPGPIFGTKNEDLTRALVEQVVNVTLNSAGKHDVENSKYAVAAIHGIGPKDELEGLLAVQMIGIHSLAMEYMKRASWEGLTKDGIDTNVNRAIKLAHTFTAQMEALSRHRGKVGEKIVMRDVNVNEGGQAIVGPVSHEGRGKASSEDDADKVK
jgi:hypothetical protein